VDMDVFAQFHTAHHVTWTDEGEPIERRYTALNSEFANEITERMREFPDTEVFGTGSDLHTFRAHFTYDMLSQRMREAIGFNPEGGEIERWSITLVVLDAENYAAVSALAGVPVGSNILINQITFHQGTGRTIFAPFEFDNQTIQVENIFEETEFELPLHGVLNIGEVPAEITETVGGGFNIIVPELEALTYVWCVRSADPAGFTEFAREMLHDMIEFDRELGGLSVVNVREDAAAMQDIGLIVIIFVYGFITMLTLIGLTNVVSTVSTNIYARSKEFAILKSVGMDRRGLSRTLNLESVFCTIRAVVIGLPIGLLASWLIHNSIGDAVDFPFEIPWVIMAQCVLGVFIITWGVTRFSARKLRGQNVVETIRMESGM